VKNGLVWSLIAWEVSACFLDVKLDLGNNLTLGIWRSGLGLLAYDDGDEEDDRMIG